MTADNDVKQRLLGIAHRLEESIARIDLANAIVQDEIRQELDMIYKLMDESILCAGTD